MPKGSALSKELKCSEELQAITKTKKISRGKMMKVIWKFIKRKGLQGPDGADGRVIKLDDRLMAVVCKSSKLKKAIKEKRKITMRGNTIKIPKGCIFMTELAGGLSKNLS